MYTCFCLMYQDIYFHLYFKCPRGKINWRLHFNSGELAPLGKERFYYSFPSLSKESYGQLRRS